MIFEGKIWKEEELFWLVEIPLLSLMTQGTSQENALDMLKDAFQSLIGEDEVAIKTTLLSTDGILLEVEDTLHVLPVVLQRLRLTSEMSLKETSISIGQDSKNAIARYEQGKACPSVEKFQQILAALGYDFVIVAKNKAA
jgi:predicted RNase H-like HicB family nuclease